MHEWFFKDCSGFIVTQLFPTWQKLGSSGIFKIRMYPFGNARETRLPNGTYSYHCQHGQQECEGNLLEVCLMKSLNFRAQKYLPILACE